MNPIKARAFSIASAAAVFALDRVTKWLIDSRVEMWETHTVIPGFFDIVHTRNKGVAFGLGNDNPGQWQSYMLVGLTVLITLFLLGMVWRATSANSREHWSLVLGLSLVLGGAAGNLFDRAIYGSVTDFLDFYIGAAHWPVFNIADCGISVGAVLLVWNVWKSRETAPATTGSR